MKKYRKEMLGVVVGILLIFISIYMMSTVVTVAAVKQKPALLFIYGDTAQRVGDQFANRAPIKITKDGYGLTYYWYRFEDVMLGFQFDTNGKLIGFSIAPK